ncbi:MAG TPA: phosphoenolpyruvate carboxylase, partial [Vicinamibacterales bacterium]|nr:phosphoenolpyruvate carboxylase [Vicinamibacterales bacterium]
LPRAIRATLDVTGHHELLEENAVLERSINVRNPYVDPINLVQIEVLRRLRLGRPEGRPLRTDQEGRPLHTDQEGRPLRPDHDDERLRDAFVVTVNGIAAGMRNAG